MNIKEAIKELNERIELIEREYLIERDYADELPEYLEVMKMAIEALRKQEPMKPKLDGEFGLCKRCGYVFNSELISEYCVKYCPNCGQAIDWSEE